MKTQGMKRPTPMTLIPLPHTLDASFLLANEGDCPSLSRQNTKGMVPNNTATLKDAPPLLDGLCARGNHHIVCTWKMASFQVHTCIHLHARLDMVLGVPHTRVNTI